VAGGYVESGPGGAGSGMLCGWSVGVGVGVDVGVERWWEVWLVLLSVWMHGHVIDFATVRFPLALPLSTRCCFFSS